jgi:hypothetical protein
MSEQWGIWWFSGFTDRQADSCCSASILREHKISRCMLQHRFQARPEEARSHQAQKNGFNCRDG